MNNKRLYIFMVFIALSISLGIFLLSKIYEMKHVSSLLPLYPPVPTLPISLQIPGDIIPIPVEIIGPLGTTSSPFLNEFPPSATTSQAIGRGGVSDTSAQTPSDVVIAYSGNVLVYHNTTLGFEFGLPSIDKKLRLNDSGSYSRRSEALVWLWFTKNFDIATANFFVTPTTASSISELSFDYNFTGYPRYMGTLLSGAITVNGEPALEETVSYESASPGYPNTWKFIHVLHDEKLYTFGAQIAPVQAINEKEVEQMIIIFKSSFRFLP